MATISDITQAASYRGDPALGGGLGTAITIDPSPLQRLATFTYYRDRDLWMKKQKDNAEAAKKIADIAAYDVTSPLKPYTDDLTREVNELHAEIRKDPSMLTYDSRNPQKWIDLSQRIGRIENKRKHATVNDTLYNAEKARVEKLPPSADRDKQLELLDINVQDLFKDGVETAYGKQIRTSPELKPDDYKMRPIPNTEVFTIDRNANDVVIEGKAFADIGRLDALTDAEYFRLSENRVKTDTDEFKKLSDNEKRRVVIESEITDKKIIALDSTAKTISGLVTEFRTKFVDAKGQPIPLEKVPEDEISKAGGSVADYIKSVKNFNNEIDALNAATGKKFSHINLDDGATPQELMKLDFFNNNGGTLYKELEPKFIETDIELKKRGQDLDYQAAWLRNNTPDKDPLVEAIENPARTFGKHIETVKDFYRRKVPANRDMLVPYHQLDADTRKALGIPDVDPKNKNKKSTEQNTYVVYYRDGSYRIGADAKGKGGNPGTLEQLRKGFIDITKGGDALKGGVQSEGFQKNAENGFYKIYGTNNSQTIWDGWGGATTPNQGSSSSSSSSSGGGRPKTVIQNGVTYTLNEKTGKYE